MDETAKEHIKILAFLKSTPERVRLNADLEKSRVFTTPEKGSVINGVKKDRPIHVIIDEVAEANTVHGRGMYSNLLPANTRVADFEDADEKLMEKQENKDFFSKASIKMYDWLMNSNLAMEMTELFNDAGAVSTTSIYSELDEDRVFNFRTYPLENFWIKQNNKGRIDTYYREFTYTPRQAVQEFGQENLGDKVIRSLNSSNIKSQNKLFTFIHAVSPNYDREVDVNGEYVAGNQNMAFKSIYVGVEDKNNVIESGYEEMPYAVGRLEKISGHNYGTCAGLSMIRTFLMLNKMEHTNLKAAQKAVDPPVSINAAAMQGGSNGQAAVAQHFNHAGAVNMHDGTMPGGAPSYAPTPSNVPIGWEAQDRKKRMVEKAFFVNVFEMLQQLKENGGTQTAYEISKLIAERHSLIIPVVARIMEETLTPLFRRCFMLAFRAGLFDEIMTPEIAERLKQDQLKINFVSPLALATRMSGLNSFQNALQNIVPLLEMDPGLVDLIDTDEVTRDTFQLSGAPSKYIRSKVKVDELRKKRAEAAAQQQEADKSMELATSPNIMKKPEDGSAGQGMMENAMGALNGRV